MDCEVVDVKADPRFPDGIKMRDLNEALRNGEGVVFRFDHEDYDANVVLKCAGIDTQIVYGEISRTGQIHWNYARLDDSSECEYVKLIKSMKLEV